MTDEQIKYQTAIILLEETRDNSYPMSPSHKDAINIAIKSLEDKSDAEEYRTPKKVIFNYPAMWYKCPTCSSSLGLWGAGPEYDYCPSCGQALDWNLGER